LHRKFFFIQHRIYKGRIRRAIKVLIPSGISK
jgi:hypothetical protein